MNNAIERIKGHCCKVDQEQWKELVKTADEVGCPVGSVSRQYGVVDHYSYAKLNAFEELRVCRNHHVTIDFSDFIAKLRGEEEWTPKAGEMVEVSPSGDKWFEREFIGYSRGKYVGWAGDGEVHAWPMCRPLTPTITRAEAEKQLGKRIVN